MGLSFDDPIATVYHAIKERLKADKFTKNVQDGDGNAKGGYTVKSSATDGKWKGRGTVLA
ncbi:hypothetical protein AMTR_s00052p00166960 [Amborella trichopoda]|uniref:Uncharacterized protein n=1 Tax=Amborella trichopoda TaxID=13333 RepID=U5D7T2_AMBTC|nr:hypothetical protein AMTR_s00052p00166960 [Amborella trichopoda]